MSIRKFNYQESPISFDFLDSDTVYVNATEMAKRFNKLPAQFTLLSSTKEYVQALKESVVGNSNNGDKPLEFIKTVKGGAPQLQGTWYHRRLALRFAQWLSPRLAVWMDGVIEQYLLKGRIDPGMHPLHDKEQKPDSKEKQFGKDYELLQIRSLKLLQKKDAKIIKLQKELLEIKSKSLDETSRRAAAYEEWEAHHPIQKFALNLKENSPIQTKTIELQEKQELARLQLKSLLQKSKKLNKNKLARLVKLSDFLTRRELSELFHLSHATITTYLRLNRWSRGDFSETQPQQLRAGHSPKTGESKN